MAEQKTGRLSAKTVAVLRLIADGQSYAQIVDGHPGLTYLDIFAAAEEALRLDETPSDYQARLAAIKAKYPMAYEPWSEEDDALLRAMHAARRSIDAMSEEFQRQPSAIRSRLRKFGLD